jgi:hypothetical protein
MLRVPRQLSVTAVQCLVSHGHGVQGEGERGDLSEGDPGKMLRRGQGPLTPCHCASGTPAGPAAPGNRLTTLSCALGTAHS